jgi:hypothetical protein
MAAKGKPTPMVLPQRMAAGTGRLMDNQDTVHRGDSKATTVKRRRITFDTTEERARKLKALAASNGMTVRELMELMITVFEARANANPNLNVREVARAIAGDSQM